MTHNYELETRPQKKGYKKVGTFTYRKRYRHKKGERRGFVNLENRVLEKLGRKYIVEFIEGKWTYRTSVVFLRRMGSISHDRTYLPKSRCFQLKSHERRSRRHSKMSH